MTLRKFGLALVTVSLFIIGFLSPAQAADPVTIPPGTFVVDESDVLSSSQEDELEQQVRQLQSEHGASLFIIYVPSFENPAEPDQWVEAVAEQKQLGTNDNILAIATDDRYYNFVTNSAGPFRQYQSDIDRQYILPALSNSDWFGAGEGAIQGLAAAAGGDVSSGGAGNQSSGAGWLLWLLPIGILVAFLIWRSSSKKKERQQRAVNVPAGPTDPRDAMPVDELRTQAGSALIQADDAIKIAEQEIGFAQASYGDASVEVFQKDLQAAKDHMQQSFQLQHQLDDHIPDTEEDQRAWLKEILDRSAQVMSSLQAHEQDFAKLRDLEQNAPEALQRVKAVFAPLPAQIQTAQATIDDLSAHYDGPTFEEGVENLEQAKRLLAFGEEKIHAADTALQQGDTSQAAWNVHEAENTTQELQELFASIQQLPEQLDKAQRQLDVELAQAQSVLAEAKEFAAQHRTDSALPRSIAALEQAVDQISAQTPSRRPVKDLEALDDTLDPLAEQLQPLRDRQQQVDAARREFDPLMARARTTIDAADDYIRRRRGAVRHDARTKLAAAQTHFNTALDLRNTNPVQAVAEAQQAVQLGRLAQQLAEQNYHDFDDFHRGGGNRGGSNMGAMLGGILLGNILSGGGHSSSWGGGGFSGGGGGGGFFGGSGGGFGGGGFGGGSGGSF